MLRRLLNENDATRRMEYR